MFDFKNVRNLSEKELKELFDETVNAPLDEELIEIVKALADK
ncbi:hypothetical protein [Malacoplasma muris]